MSELANFILPSCPWCGKEMMFVVTSSDGGKVECEKCGIEVAHTFATEHERILKTCNRPFVKKIEFPPLNVILNEIFPNEGPGVISSNPTLQAAKEMYLYLEKKFGGK